MDRPEAPNILQRFFGTGAVSDYAHDRELYDLQEKQRIQQQMNPAREMTLGQVSNLSGHPAEQIAAPDQMTRTMEPSSVPSYRYVPTMRQGPEVQGPPDITQGPDDSYGRPSKIVYHYPEQSGSAQEEVTPQVRQRAGNLTLPSLQAPETQNKTIGSFQPEQGPEQQITRVNENAPANLYQQMLGTSSLERETKWPRSFGGGAQTLQAKVQSLIASGIPEDQARQIAVLGDTYENKTANLQGRTRASNSRADSLDAGVDLGRDKFNEQHAQNMWMRDFRNRQLDLAIKRHQEGVQRGENSNELGWARLNNKRWYEDNMLAIYGDLNKGGRFSPQEQDALHKGMGFLQTMEERDLTPQEETMWGHVKSLLGIPEPPAYQWKPRPPLSPQKPQRGTAPPMARSGSISPSNSAGSPQQGSTSRQSPVPVQSDADYEKLPSGTQFIGPDGKTRTKP